MWSWLIDKYIRLFNKRKLESIFDYWVTGKSGAYRSCPICGQQPEVGPSGCVWGPHGHISKVTEWEICCSKEDHLVQMNGSELSDLMSRWNRMK